MASTKKVKKDKKDSKKDYEPAVAVHRVLLAIMQLQKGSNENAFNLEDIRDQARLSSRLPSAQFGRVGCGWILSFNKALKWMTKVRILQNVTLETVAFSDLATMVLSNSAHLQSIPNSSSPEENYYWQELIGFSKGDPPIRLVELQEAGLFLPGRKRSVSEESSPNKRAKISDRPKKKKKKVKETLSAPPRLNGGQPTTGRKRGRPRKIQPQPQVEVQENTDEEIHLPQANYTLPSLGDDEMEVDIENDDDDQEDNEDEDDENEEGEEDEDEDEEEEEDDDDDGSEYGELNESEEEVDYTPRKSSVARAVSSQSTIANDEGNEFDVPRHNVSPSSQRTTLESNSASCYQGIIHLSSGSYTLVNPSKTIVRHAGPHAPPAPRSSLRESYTHETIHDVPNGQPHTYNNNIDVDSVRDRDQGWSRHPGPRHLPPPSHPNQHKTNNHTHTNNNHNHNHNHHNNVYQPPGLIDDRTGPRYTTQSPAPSSITPKGNGNLHVISRQTTSQPRKSSAQSQSAAGPGARAISTPEGASGTSTTTGYPHQHHHPQGGAKVPGYRHDVGPNGVALSLSPKLARLETLAIVSSQRDETIFALEDAKEKLGAELSELHRSCERAEHTVVRTTQQLQDAVREVNGLKRERAYTIDRLRAVKKMNDEACSERDMLKKEVEGMKERETDLENSHRRLEGRINDLVRELEEMKRVSSLGRDKDKESTSPIDNMNGLDSNDPASHAGGDEDDDEDLERTPTVSKSRTVENPIGVQMQSLGNDSLSHSRDTGKGKSAERSRSPSVRSTAAAKGGASNYVPNTTSTLLTQDDDLMDSSLVDFQITQNEHPAGARLSMSEQLENAGKRELEILTGLREKIGTLVSTFQAQEKANQVLQDEVHATRALLIELEQTDRGQMSAQASSQFEGVLRAAIADVDDVGDRLGKGNLERKELGLQLGKTKDGVKNLGDFLRDERQRSSLLAAKLEESLGKTRSLEDELEYYRKMKTIDPNDMKGVYDSFGAFKQLQIKALGDLGFKVKDLRQ